MQPLDIAIFAVVLTAVSLAAAQTAFLNLPEDPEEVSLINKVVGQLGVCSRPALLCSFHPTFSE